MKSAAAALIREHLWQPETPGPTSDGRPWTMGRELRIWDFLARRVGDENLNGAITKLRTVTGHPGPLRLTWFVSKKRGPVLLELSISEWHKTRPAPPVSLGSLARMVVPE